jgi:hypothetical protein
MLATNSKARATIGRRRLAADRSCSDGQGAEAAEK